MSDKNDINRRKVLTTAAGASVALVGGPAAAAAKNADGTAEITEEELEAALEAATTQVRTESSSVEGLRPSMTGASALSPTDGPDVFVGKKKNAELPGVKPFAVESEAEFLQRDVPLHVANASEVQEVMIPDFYRTETIGSFSLAGYDIELKVGAGLKFEFNASEIGVSLSVDIFIDIAGVGSFTVTPSGFTFGISKRGGSEGYCIDFSINPSNLPKMEFEICGNVKIITDGDTFKAKFSASVGDVCADVYLGELCVNPPISAGIKTPSYELPY